MLKLKELKDMSQYLIRQRILTHEITKFEDSDSPTVQYSLSARGCNCPATSKYCKHTRILKAWEKLNKPLGAVFDDDAQLIHVMAVD